MFGYMLFSGKSGASKTRTPAPFEQQARRDVEARVSSLKSAKKKRPQKGFKSSLSSSKHGSSPLARAVVSAVDDSSSIDSGKSGRSLSAASVQRLLLQQQQSLSRVQTLASTTFDQALQLHEIYTNTTAPTTLPVSFPDHPDCVLSLSEALPKDFSDYYAPDLDVPRFSNGRPRYTKRNLKNWELNDTRSLLIYPDWPTTPGSPAAVQGALPSPPVPRALPHIQSPIKGKSFRIQIIPYYASDAQIIQELVSSDIYKEATFEPNFREKTAQYIVEKARRRHAELLVNSFEVGAEYFNEYGLIGNMEYDSYFKFEWRNIIENFLLTLAIEYQCRSDFKFRLSQLIGADNAKRASAPSDNLYKRTLMKRGIEITEDMKAEIWKDVQNKVYSKLDDY